MHTTRLSPVIVAVISGAGIGLLSGTGHMVSANYLPSYIYPLAFAAVFGGFIGSALGSRRFANATFYYLLAMILTIAGIRLVLGT